MNVPTSRVRRQTAYLLRPWSQVIITQPEYFFTRNASVWICMYITTSEQYLQRSYLHFAFSLLTLCIFNILLTSQIILLHTFIERGGYSLDFSHVFHLFHWKWSNEYKSSRKKCSLSSVLLLHWWKKHTLLYFFWLFFFLSSFFHLFFYCMVAVYHRYLWYYANKGIPSRCSVLKKQNACLPSKPPFLDPGFVIFIDLLVRHK